MDETIVFALATHVDAVELCEYLEPGRLCAVEFEDLGWHVRAGFGPDPADLAHLLRDVEAWAARRTIGEIPFLVDDRTYVLLTYDAQLAQAG
jgi:hypothetical protein